MVNRYIFRCVSAALIALSAVSCGIYTKYKSPEVDVTQVAAQGFEMADSAAIEVPSWQAFFEDAQLRSLIEQALAANSDLATARLNISQAERGLTTARLAFLPQLSLGAEGSLSSFDGSTPIKSYSVPVSASWEIDIFGRLRNSKEQARTAVEQSYEYAQMVQTQLVSAVASSYYGLILADQQLEITRQSKDILAQSVESIKALMEVGMQNRAAVEQAEASYKELEMALIDIEKSITLLEANLALLLNLTPREFARAQSIEMGDGSQLEGSISLAALSARPDVRYAEMMLAQSFYGVNYARSALYPSIRLGGSAGWTNNAGVIVNPGAMLLSAIGSLTQPIFMAGVNRANLANAKDRYEQQVIAFEKSLLVAGKEVNDALVEREAAAAKCTLSAEQVARLDSAVQTTRALMTSGRSNYLEVLSAQSSYLSARLNQASISYEDAIAQINLYRALGGGVQ